MIKEIKGSLFDSPTKVIAHGANTLGIMGAGIARSIKAIYPNNFKTYNEKCLKGEFKLGDVLLVEDNKRIVANLGTQNELGAHASLQAVKLSFVLLMEELQKLGLKEVAIPKIGCGIGGLEWKDVREIVEEVSENYGVTVLVYYLD